jgi:protein-tyrosine phosphatase
LVDIHSHILPGIDDGATTVEESIEMLKLAAASGTTDIVATPHANSNYSFDVAERDRLLDELSAQVNGVIKLHRGCDFHLSFDNLMDALEKPTKYTVNGGRYLMVELPDMVSLTAMRTAVNRLLDARITPVVTHPERNPSVQAQIQALDDWARDGCLFQVTGQSLTGRFGSTAQRTAETLMNSDMVHFVASDAHDCEDRPPDLSGAYKVVLERWGAERAERLFVENPSAVIWDEMIFAPPPKPVKKSSFFAFWK